MKDLLNRVAKLEQELAHVKAAMIRKCDIASGTLGRCDLEYGHDGRMHASKGDGFYSSSTDFIHQKRQLRRRGSL